MRPLRPFTGYAIGVWIVAVGAITAQESGIKVYGPTDGVVMPIVLKSVRAGYTGEAMKAGIEGWNKVEAIVLPDGTVSDVKMVHSLDPTYGLDRVTVESVKQWKFKPGMKDGQPVAVRVTIKNAFTLHAVQRGKRPRRD
jgi:TonB family protein